MINKYKQFFLKLFRWMQTIKKNFDQSIPIYTNTLNTGIKIHLGPGDINLQGWINVDANSKKHIHIIDNDFSMNGLVDESVSEFYLCHVLEHFSFLDSNLLINKIYKKLKVGGVIRISVPNFEKLSQIYRENQNLDMIKFALMGGQKDDYDFHKSIYDFKTLKNLLILNNFNNISLWNSEDFGQDINDWSEGFYKVNNKKVHISLNLKGIKK